MLDAVLDAVLDAALGRARQGVGGAEAALGPAGRGGESGFICSWVLNWADYRNYRELSNFHCLTEIIGADKLRPLPLSRSYYKGSAAAEMHEFLDGDCFMAASFLIRLLQL